MAAKQNRTIRKNLMLSSCAIVFLTTALFVLNIISLSGILPYQGKALFFIIDLLLLSSVSFLAYITFLYINRSLLIPLSSIKKAANETKTGESLQRIPMFPYSEVNEVACAFNEISACLKESQEKLKFQSSELNDRNWELQEANSELEASYGQLQAIIEQLNDAEEKYHSLVRNIPEIVCVIENTGIISFVNHVCYDILGYEKSDLIGKSIYQIISPNSKAFSIEDTLVKLNNGNAYVIELSLLRKDGVTIVTEAKFTNYVFNGVSMGLQAIIRDITTRRRLERQILQNNKELLILNSVSKSLTSTLDIDELSRLIVNEITQALECPCCILSFVEKDNSTLEVKAYSGEFYEQDADRQVFEPLSLVDKDVQGLLENCETLKPEDFPTPWFMGSLCSDASPNKQVNELLSVPVSIKDKKFGTIIVGFSSQVGEHEINLITSIANNAAVAIDNALLYETSKKYFIKTVDALIATVEAKDDYTEGHSQRVSKYAVDIAEKLGLSKEQIEDIKVAGMLHDIGKIGISDTILLKPEKLTSDEYEVIKQHPLISNKILYPVGFSERTMKAIAFHHERYDGKGYPYGLIGDDIAIEAQIISVADAYDAMTSSRSYRRAMSSQDALKELRVNCTTQFNPKIVDAFFEAAKSYKEFLY